MRTHAILLLVTIEMVNNNSIRINTGRQYLFVVNEPRRYDVTEKKSHVTWNLSDGSRLQIYTLRLECGRVPPLD